MSLRLSRENIRDMIELHHKIDGSMEFMRSHDIFDGIWKLVVHIQYGYLAVSVQLHCIPTSIRSMDVQCRFYLSGFHGYDVRYNNVQNKKMMKQTYMYGLPSPPVKLFYIETLEENFENIDENGLMLYADVLIVEEYDTMGNNVTTQRIEREWMEFIQDNDHKYEDNDYSVSDLNKLDDRTKKIVLGYIRKTFIKCNDYRYQILMIYQVQYKQCYIMYFLFVWDLFMIFYANLW